MSSNSGNIVSGIHHLRMSKEFFEDYMRSNPGSRGESMFKNYVKRFDWVITDMLSHPFLPATVIDGIRKEWNSDVFAVPAIAEKIALLRPEQREMMEEVIDAMLNGEEISIVEPEKN